MARLDLQTLALPLGYAAILLLCLDFPDETSTVTSYGAVRALIRSVSAFTRSSEILAYRCVVTIVL
jgi:hypothetical protein